MMWLLKTLYGGTLKYIYFLVALYGVVAAFLIFLFYPLQTVVSIVGIFVVVVLFMYFSELK